METREIKIRSFVYEEPYEDFDGSTRNANRQAKRGDVVELDPYWIKYGDAMGAFVTEADREAEEDEDVITDAESVEEMGDDELMNWVSDSTIPQVLAVAKADPSLCDRILKAENAATGNDPRNGLVEALTHIVGSGEESSTGSETETGETEEPVEEETVEQLAERLKVPLDDVDGTGDEGAVTLSDVKEYYDEELADATDSAVELADEEDIFLADITPGSGADGRITKDDVTKFIAAQNEATTD